MVFYTLFGALIDVIGLAFLIPVMMAATDPAFVTENRYMAGLYEGLGFEQYSSFMMFLGLALLLVFVLKNTLAMLLHYAHSSYSFSVATNMARRQFIKYYQRGFQFFKATNSGEIMNKIINVPSFFASGVLISAINIVSESMVMLFIVIGIALVDPALFFAVMAVLIPAGLIIYSSSKNRLYQLGQEQNRLHAINYSRLNQAIFGFTDVKLTNKEHHFLNAYAESQGALNRTLKLRYMLSLIPTRALEVMAILGVVVIFAYSLLFSDNPQQLFGFIALFAAAAFRVLPSMNRLLNAVMGMKNHQVTLEILEEGSLPQDMERPTIVPMQVREAIEFRDLTFAYEDAEAPSLDGVSFRVARGEKIGIIGESGSGKTTLVNVLLRFLPEQSGGIYVDGKLLAPEDTPNWRAIVGYVQQKVFLTDSSLRENVAFGEKEADIDDARVQWALEQASMWSFVQTMPEGLDTRIGENGAKLSGGQQQRVGIARALYWISEVLVFDEATSALDMETETSITESIEALASGQTLFVIAHRITTLRHCDRILEMKAGRIVQEWQYADLVREKLTDVDAPGGIVSSSSPPNPRPLPPNLSLSYPIPRDFPARLQLPPQKRTFHK